MTMMCRAPAVAASAVASNPSGPAPWMETVCPV